jgi:glutaredoxin 3
MHSKASWVKSGTMIVMYGTSIATTIKVRSDVARMKQILDGMGVPYEEVDLSLTPERRATMLADSAGKTQLPQVHVNGKYIGTTDEIIDMNDFGELMPVLKTSVPATASA